MRTVTKKHPRYTILPVKKIYFSADTPAGHLQVSSRQQAKLELFPLTKNLKKRFLIKSSSDPRGFMAFYYVDSPHHLCLSFRGWFISIQEEDLTNLKEAISLFQVKEQQRVNEHLEYLKKVKEEHDSPIE